MCARIPVCRETSSRPQDRGRSWNTRALPPRCVPGFPPTAPRALAPVSRGCEALAGPTLPSGPHSSWVGGRATRPRQPQDASQLCDFPSKRSHSSPQGPHPFPLHKCSLNPYNTFPVIPPGPAKPRPAHQQLTGTGSLPGTCCLACYRIIRSGSSSLIFNV